jgi:hypothetical protein
MFSFCQGIKTKSLLHPASGKGGFVTSKIVHLILLSYLRLKFRYRQEKLLTAPEFPLKKNHSSIRMMASATSSMDLFFSMLVFCNLR